MVACKLGMGLSRQTPLILQLGGWCRKRTMVSCRTQLQGQVRGHL